MKTSTRPVAQVHCPIEPETLLADIQGELLIDEARAIRHHIETCERCRARSEQLREAYEQVAGLADVPVLPPANVRDTILRESQGHLRTVRLAHRLNLPTRGLLLGVVGVVAAVVVLIAIVAKPLLQGHVLSAQRSQNSLKHVAAVGPGFFYAETIKLIPVSVNGTEWDLGEIAMLDEHTGQVIRSLPASSQSPFVPDLGIGAGTDIRPALSPNGQTIIEAAIPSDGHSPTAFAAIDATTGAVRYVTRMVLPTGVTAQADPVIRQMWISGDNATAYILTDLTVHGRRSPHLLQFALNNGNQETGVLPPLDSTTALGGNATIISTKDGALYDATTATDTNGHPGAQITFAATATHTIAATLFVPGDFGLIALAASTDGSQIFLFDGKTATIYFIATTSRSVVATLPLQGTQASPFSGNISGDVSLAVSPDNQQLIAVSDRIAGSQQSFNLWIISIDQQSFLTLIKTPQPAGQAMATSNGSAVVMLRSDGTLDEISATSPQQPQHWVVLADKAAIIQLVGAYTPKTPKAGS